VELSAEIRLFISQRYSGIFILFIKYGSAYAGGTRSVKQPLAVMVSASYASESRKAQPARNRFREVEEEHVH
jgi:hypothetical protein